MLASSVGFEYKISHLDDAKMGKLFYNCCKIFFMPFYAVMTKDPGRMFGWDDSRMQNRVLSARNPM
ncbi:MAG TPA: hypothetical protein DER33_06180 [Syntrophomonas sp.]|nr:hypothetical protein [Syntrophomonas sp.]